ncbi:reverse transcriptase-like protein [Candidatus Saccharibacteria bacterium]|nr:reverse transcriptase-like protein [Candidatus Saccharibacteria bacterium]
MKQRIRVMGILRRGEEILLLKKRAGRSDAPVFYELLNGKIKFGEQPEEAMGRIVKDDLGIDVKEIKLKDVVTFLAFSGASQIANLYIIYEIFERKGSGAIRLGEKYSAYKLVKLGETSKLSLEEASRTVLGLEDEKAFSGEELREVVNGATVYVDGSSRGNPGPAGIGYYIVGEDGRILRRGGEFIGFATSRVAEYYALKEGVEQAVELGLKNVKFVGDNLMMINQMNGIYRVKNRDLLPIYQDIRKLVEENLTAVAFVHVKREHNLRADEEANRAIDRHFGENVIE